MKWCDNIYTIFSKCFVIKILLLESVHYCKSHKSRSASPVCNWCLHGYYDRIFYLHNYFQLFDVKKWVFGLRHQNGVCMVCNQKLFRRKAQHQGEMNPILQVVLDSLIKLANV